MTQFFNMFSLFLLGSISYLAEFCTDSFPMQTDEGEILEKRSSKVSEIVG